MKPHSSTAAERWRALSLSEQLGNIGSDIGRTGSWLARGKAAEAESAFFRALELFDLTLGDGRWTGGRRREIARARESFCDDYLRANVDALRALDRYFGRFALFARRGR